MSNESNALVADNVTKKSDWEDILNYLGLASLILAFIAFPIVADELGLFAGFITGMSIFAVCFCFFLWAFLVGVFTDIRCYLSQLVDNSEKKQSSPD